MDFLYIGNQDTQITSEDYDCEFSGFDEDDVSYTELRRQVLLLTADENDGSGEPDSGGVSRQSSSRLAGGFPTTLEPGSYFNWWGNTCNDSVPTWLAKLWRNGNGTGVFIPQIVRSRSFSRRGRMNVGRRRIYRQSAEAWRPNLFIDPSKVQDSS